MSIHADLHVHTTHSDGQLTLDEIPTAAADAGVSVVAVTDHDRIHPGLDETLTTHDGITIIRGIELRVKPKQLDERIDLLGYGVTPTDDLQAESDRLQQNRIERAGTIISRVEDQLDVDLELEPTEGMGRPHIARAIDDHPDIPHTYEGAFEDLIGRDCPAYESRNVTSFEDGLALLRDACDIVGLAHPYRYDDPVGALALTKHLDAVEHHYPYDPMPASMGALDDVIQQYDLLETGGSDAHDKTLGRAGLIEEHYDRLHERLTG